MNWIIAGYAALGLGLVIALSFSGGDGLIPPHIVPVMPVLLFTGVGFMITGLIKITR